MAEQVLLINVRPVWARLPLLLLAVAALASAWYAMRWGMGDTMAEYAPVTYATDPAGAFETAESAARLAPDDPLAHLMLARLNQISFDTERTPIALAEYERAAALAPNDYLVWTEVGRARSALGDMDGGIAALKRATELAPNYSLPRWHFGNALLRAGRTDEAFEELRRAADADPALRPQVFNLAWQLYAQDMPRIIEAVGKSPAARAQLIGVLIARTRFDEALAVWSSLGAEEKREQKAAGETLARSLYERGQYQRSLQTLGETGAQGLALEKISNGSFESDVGHLGAQLFEWQVVPAPVQVAVDARIAHEGARSLRILFNSSGQVDFRNVWQVVAVQPSTRYRLSYFVRTDKLESAATLVTIVTDTATETPALGSSAALASGTSDWQQVTIDFTTGPKTEGVVVRVVRVACPAESCPIYGKIWYDDFDLQRAGGR